MLKAEKTVCFDRIEGQLISRIFFFHQEKREERIDLY